MPKEHHLILPSNYRLPEKDIVAASGQLQPPPQDTINLHLYNPTVPARATDDIWKQFGGILADFAALRERVADLEERCDKHCPLKPRLESAEAAIKKTGEDALSEKDVVRIIVAIIVGIAAVVGATSGVLKLLKIIP